MLRDEACYFEARVTKIESDNDTGFRCCCTAAVAVMAEGVLCWSYHDLPHPHNYIFIVLTQYLLPPLRYAS